MIKNLIHHLVDRFETHPTGVAIRYKDKSRWHSYRWQDVFQVVNSLAAGLEQTNIKKGDRIAIMSETRPEWFLSDLAIMALGAVTVPIYPNLQTDDVSFILEDSDSRILILEDLEQYNRWLEIKAKHKDVRVVVIDPDGLPSSEDWISWASYLEKGRRDLINLKEKLIHLADQIELKDMATVPYTSGTTGQPKGVVLTHEQLVSELNDVFRIMPVTNKDSTLTFLPFAHILGRVEAWGAVVAGYTLAFAESIDRLKFNLQEVNPTFLIAVPRIFEKLYSAIISQAAGNPIKKIIFERALAVGKLYAQKIREGQPIPLTLTLEYRAHDELVFKQIREKLGGHLRFAVSGGAPLAAEIAEFFHGIGILIFEGYGLTETTAGICFNHPFKYRFGTVGTPLDNVQLKINDDGEVLVKSPKVMKEYFKNPQATSEAFHEGFLKTGDIGEIDKDGFLKLTDRKKDLIKTAGGKYVAPQKLENLLKLNPLVSQVLIHGDQKPYIVALITVNKLAAEEMAKQRQLKDMTFEKLIESREVVTQIKNAVAEANSHLASFESIKKFQILPTDFTIESGELTPSLKVKRKVVESKFKALIDALHKGGM